MCTLHTCVCHMMYTYSTHTHCSPSLSLSRVCLCLCMCVCVTGVCARVFAFVFVSRSECMSSQCHDSLLTVSYFVCGFVTHHDILALFLCQWLSLALANSVSLCLSTLTLYSTLCVLLPLESLLWDKLRDYAISRVNPNPRQVFLVRVVKMW